MAKTITSVFLILICSLSSYAGVYLIPYQEVVPGAEGYVSVDPVVDGNEMLEGFIFCDSINKQIMMSRIDEGVIYALTMDYTPVATLHRYSRDHDTLHVYVLSADYKSWDQPHRLTLLSFTATDSSRVDIEPDRFAENGIATIQSHSLHFDGNGDYPAGVVYECTVEYLDWMSAEITTNHISTSILYSLDLVDPRYRISAGYLHSVDIGGDATPEYIWVDQSASSPDLADERQNSMSVFTSSTIAASTVDDQIVFAQQTWNGHSHGIAVGDFSPLLPGDELVYSGNAEDIAEKYAGKRPHVACYSMADNRVEELWYLELEQFRPRFVSSSFRAIAGLTNNNQAVFIDYSAGRVLDSTALDRQIRSPRFFETSEIEGSVNLVGLHYDTVTVFRFVLPSRVFNPANQLVEPVPSTFTLLQNYPNPFNGPTQLLFSNEATQRLTLRIFNVLGQELVTLIDNVLTAGEYEAEWDGTDLYGTAQASGIYFAQLKSDTESQMIKIIFVK